METTDQMIHLMQQFGTVAVCTLLAAIAVLIGMVAIKMLIHIVINL